MTRRNIVGMLLSRFNYNRVTVTIVHISVREWLPILLRTAFTPPICRLPGKIATPHPHFNSGLKPVVIAFDKNRGMGILPNLAFTQRACFRGEEEVK